MLGDNTAPGDAFEQHVSRVQQAERDGFSTAWFAQTFGLDTLTFAALLAPKMLAIAGSVGDGTITWMTGPKTLREHIIPRLRAAAAEAGRPAPRVVAGFPVAVAADVQQARDTAAQVFQMYGALPSYRAMLDREGVEGPADIAVVGDEAAVGARLDELAALGVTDFMGALYPTGPDPRATIERSWTFLATRAQRAAT